MSSFFQVIPQAICTRYGLAVGANFAGLVRILMIICYPIAYPIGKVNSKAITFELHFFEKYEMHSFNSHTGKK